MAKVVHFEIPADDPQRAAKFYQEAFGWQISKWEGPMEYWLAMTGPEEEAGIHGAITPRQGYNENVVNMIGIESLADTVAKIKAAGGTILAEAVTVPGVGVMAYFRDTEGNVFCALQPEAMPPA